MNRITEQLLQAISVVADQKISQLQYDKTIQAKIYSVNDIDTGEYRVRYNGNIFLAYSEDTSKTYSVDDEVYVVVPEGNFSNRKIITSLVSAQSLSYSQLQQMQNTVVSVSPSMTDMYQGVKEPPYQVVAGIDSGTQYGTDWIYNNQSEYNPSDYHGLFQQYASQYENIRISASFMTRFHCIHDSGNYGIEVGFYTKDNNVVSYKLDLNSFNGDPYSLSVYSQQYAIIKVQKGYLLGLKYVKLFQEGFTPDKLIENGLVTDKENLTVPNIFAKDISIDFVTIKDLTDTTYYLNIAALRGITISNTVYELELVGRVIYQGKDLMDEKTCQCQWFERDLSVMIGTKDYDKAAGYGWKPIDNQTHRLTLTGEDVNYTQQYKLLVTYNGKVSLSAEIQVYNSLNSYDFELEQLTNGADIILRIKDQNLTGDWYMAFPDGSYVEIPDSKDKNSVVISQYLQYSSVVFYCAVYAAGRVYLGPLSHTIMTSESEDDVTIQYVGEDTFRYDTNGDIDIESAEKDRTLQVNLSWKEGYGTSYYVHWVMRDSDGREVELPSDITQRYNPPNSMMEGLWVDNYNIMHYNIKQKYKVNYINNTLVVKIETISGEVYLFDKEILFLKDGDQGTNGTTYVAAIRPCDSNGNKVAGLHPIVYNSRWTQGTSIRCYVYRDGEFINRTSGYDITYKWTGNNVLINGQVSPSASSGLDQVGIQGSGIPNLSRSNTLEFYVKVQVDITDRNHDNKKITIYASYPIDVAVGGIDYSVVDIDNVPSYIKYNSSGLTPQFYSNNISYLYNGVNYDNYIISANTKLLTIRNDANGNRYLEPAASFVFDTVKNTSESDIAVLWMRDPASTSRYIIHPIIMYLDTYGNEAINGWDGTTLDTGNGEYVFAPQVGAGTKDSSNRFTGVVMGKDSGQNQIGLYGYSSGINTFGLKQDGKAYFGVNGNGRIDIDGTSATISGGGGGNSDNGMTIYLARTTTTNARSTYAIRVANGNFYVTYDGDAYLSGTIYARAGKIGCNENKLGGWTITSNRLYSGSSTTRVELNSESTNDFAMWAGTSDPSLGNWESDNYNSSYAPFAVTKTGTLYAKNAVIKGTIVSKTGQIGGWTIASNKLYIDGSINVGMGSGSGGARFWVGQGLSESSSSLGEKDSTQTKFLVNSSGKLYCTNAEISGAITANSGKIGGWTISTDSLNNKDSKGYGITLSPANGIMAETATGKVTINSTEGITVNNKSETGIEFQVDMNGKLTATDTEISGVIKASGGSIGKWGINLPPGGNSHINMDNYVNTLMSYFTSSRNPHFPSDISKAIEWAIDETNDDYGLNAVDGALVGGTNNAIILKPTNTTSNPGGIFIGPPTIGESGFDILNSNFYVRTNGYVKAGGKSSSVYIEGSVVKNYSGTRPTTLTNYFVLSGTLGTLETSGNITSHGTISATTGMKINNVNVATQTDITNLKNSIPSITIVPGSSITVRYPSELFGTTLTIPTIPDLSNYATKKYVDDSIPSTSNFVSSSRMDNLVAGTGQDFIDLLEALTPFFT